MRKNLKIHAIAVTSICVVVTVIYTLVAPAPNTNAPAAGDHAVSIYSATWGANCNEYIARTNRDHQSYTAPAEKPGQPVTPQPALKPVQIDNVLLAVSTACNGRSTCTLNADSTVLGVEPAEGCYKKLTVRYRCFEYDRAWEATADQGKNLEINCNAPATPAAQ